MNTFNRLVNVSLRGFVLVALTSLLLASAVRPVLAQDINGPFDAALMLMKILTGQIDEPVADANGCIGYDVDPETGNQVCLKRGGDLVPGVTPVTTPPPGGACTDQAKYPYSQYGLDVYIPLRDTSVTVPSTLANDIKDGKIRYSLANIVHAKTEYIPIIQERALANGWNPAFVIALWLEETAGSALTTTESGGAGRGGAKSHMGCNPFGPPRSIQDELENCFFKNFNDYFTSDKFANFMARYSAGSCTVNGGDILKGICTGNPFVSPDASANNPLFVPQFKSVYSQIIPNGTRGAMEQCQQASPPPSTSPPVVSSPPSCTIEQLQDPTHPCHTSSPARGSLIAAAMRQSCGESKVGNKVYTVPITARNASCVDSVSGIKDQTKEIIKSSAVAYRGLQCVGFSFAMANEINGVKPALSGLGGACAYARDSASYAYIPKESGPPRPGDLIIWNSDNNTCDIDAGVVGHIAYITKVYNEGLVDVVEANYGVKGAVAERTVRISTTTKGWLRKK